MWLKVSSIAEINFTDFCLTLKTTSPQTVTQFRPIALCNSVYKLFTKLIVNRMKPFMDILITSNQTSFIPKRNIHENIVVVQEILHSMRCTKGKKGYFAIKIDLEIA